MRTIKFRGKASNGEWIYGSLVSVPDDEEFAAIQFQVPKVVPPGFGEDDGEYHFRIENVDPATVGQYTGRDDCEGNPIYEGDIIGLPSIYAKDQQGYTPFWVVEYDPWQGFKGFPREKVLGNIHDNPELMKGATHDK